MPIYVISDKNKFKQPIKEFRKVLIVGKNEKTNKDYLYEDSMDNIIERQRSYCEMSGLYWIWKNMNDSIVGLEHYRRYFLRDKKGIFRYHFIREKEVVDSLNEFDIILPSKTKGVNSLWDRYLSNDGINNVASDIFLLEEAVKSLSPDYFDDFEYIMKTNTEAYLCNMFITKKKLLDDYCEWSFPIFDYVYKKIDFSTRSGNQARAIGYLAERLFNVWIYHKKLKIKECPILVVKESMIKMKIKRVIKKLLNMKD